ncbi:MAG: hypothetical protein U9Q07_14235 [Planctomycetota bacterium]|nr:hypothetical protein [Planctomycetota bacterium]
MNDHAQRTWLRLTLKGVYVESAIADVVSIDPSTEFILSAVEWDRDDKATLNNDISVSIRLCHSEPAEESVKKNPAKRLDYEHAQRT